MFCSISNDQCEHPVVNKKTGHIYEKRIIDKHLQISSTDPITGESLSTDDLLDIVIPPHVKPKPPTATSIPALLKSLQDEYDAAMLYTFSMKQQVQTLKQELSHSLYQYDASSRVVSRLNKEVAAAREALATLKPQVGTIANSNIHVNSDMDIDDRDNQTAQLKLQEPIGMDNELDQKIDTLSKQLISERKKKTKQLPEGLCGVSDMEKFSILSSKVGIHSASSPGILALDINRRDDRLLITGGNDKNGIVYNRDSGQILTLLKGHSKKVTSVIYHPTSDIGITASADATTRVWNTNDGSCGHVIRAHSSAVSGLSLHATNSYVLSSGYDGYWAFSDIETGNVVVRQEALNNKEEMISLTCVKCHPDGSLFANGFANGSISICNLKEAKNVAELSNSSSAISALAFSENGYYLATGDNEGQIKLWDLRKIKVFKTINLGEERGSYQLRDLEFDKTGYYLGVAGNDVRIYSSKQWDKIVEFHEHSGLVTAIRFTDLAQNIITSSLDRTVKVYGR